MNNLDVNTQVNLHLNLNVNCYICYTLVTNVTYARMDVTSRRNAICPTPAVGRRGHKKECTFQKKKKKGGGEGGGGGVVTH